MYMLCKFSSLLYTRYKTYQHISFQVLRDRELQGGRDRRFEAEGGDAARGGRHLQVQEGQPHDVRVGDQRPPPGRERLLAGQRAQRQLNQ